MPCAVALLLEAIASGALHGQTTSPGALPLISRVDLRGVRSVPVEQLELTLSTKSTYCRLPFLRPVCYFWRSPFLVRHHYLEPGELERDIVAMRALYWQRGFRETTIDTVITEGRHGLRIAFVITEGPPTIVDTLDVERVGDVLTPEQVARAVRLERGGPLDLAALDTGLIALRNALWDAGYADATLDPRVRVDDRTRRASVRIVVDPRWRTRVASIEIEGNGRLSDEALRSALTLRKHGAFRRQDVLESQQYLYQSQGIATAAIISPPAGDSLKHVRVVVRENPPRRVGLTAGLNTIEFVQVGARAGFYALDGGHWQVEVRGATGNLFARQLEGAGPFSDVPTIDDGNDATGDFTRPTWQGSAELTRLWAGSPRNRFALGAFGHRRSEPAVFVDRGVGGFATFSRDLAPRSPLTVGYRVERAAVDAGDVYFCQSFGECDADAAAVFREPRRLASVALNWWLDRSNHPVSPSRGYTLRADADHASRATGSEYRHDRLAVEGTGYLEAGPAVIATRARLGWVRGGRREVDESVGSVLHPRALFFAGGSESVRGYDENQLGPRVLRVRAEDLLAHGCTEASLADASCDPSGTPARLFSPRPIGGTTLLEGSVELRFPISGSVAGVVFADAAVLESRDGDRSAGAVTPGIGVRYEANVGTLRLDLGWRPRRSSRLPVVVATAGEDGSPRVTRLVTERQWTEGDGERGFLRRATLHFVLGHAF
jgi:outer membrane protein assembly factor BamA